MVDAIVRGVRTLLRTLGKKKQNKHGGHRALFVSRGPKHKTQGVKISYHSRTDMGKKKLLDQGSDVIRLKHYSIRTEEVCGGTLLRWVRMKSVRF